MACHPKKYAKRATDPLNIIPMIQYAYTILYVSQVEEAVEFYEKAFGFARKFITPEGDYGEIATGTTTISFASHALGETNLKQGYQPSQVGKKPFGIELCFATDAVEATMQAAVAAGGTVLEPMVTKPWGQEVGYVQDPNGFLLEICSPMGN